MKRTEGRRSTKGTLGERSLECVKQQETCTFPYSIIILLRTEFLEFHLEHMRQHIVTHVHELSLKTYLLLHVLA